MKRKRQPSEFLDAEQIGAITFIATSFFEGIEVPDFVHNAFEATQERYGIRLVAVLRGEMGDRLAVVTEPDAIRLELEVKDALAIIYVRPIKRDSARWNAIPDCDFRREFIEHLRRSVKDYAIQETN